MFGRKTLSLLLFFSSFCGVSHGYIDPGSGSYVIQLLIAGVIGAGYGIKLYWRNLKDYLAFRGKKSEMSKDEKRS